MPAQKKPFWKRLCGATVRIVRTCYMLLVALGQIAESILALIGIYEIIAILWAHLR